MAKIYTIDQPDSRADAGEADDPPPRKRRKSLATLDDVTTEMSRLYWSMKHGEMALDMGKSLIYVLSVMVQAHKARGDDAEQLAALLKQLKERLQ